MQYPDAFSMEAHDQDQDLEQAVDQKAVDQKAVDQKAVNQEAVDQAVDQKAVDQNQLQSNKIQITQLQNAAGKGTCHFEHEHTLFVSLASRPVPYLQSQDGQAFRGIYRPGDMLITPADCPLFVQWDGDEHCVQIQLPVDFLREVAQETLGQDGDRLHLTPQFQVRDAQLNSIAQLLAQSPPDALGQALYLDSLANALAVMLLRNYATQKSVLPLYEGGLPPHQLQQVLSYMDAHLDQNLQLKDLAQRLGMSQFHFSRLFKQSLGLSPYQYLIQQRIARAQSLLQQSDRTIIEIALDCGFGSHSHFSKQFRQITGVSPKIYRANYQPLIVHASDYP